MLTIDYFAIVYGIYMIWNSSPLFWTRARPQYTRPYILVDEFFRYCGYAMLGVEAIRLLFKDLGIMGNILFFIPSVLFIIGVYRSLTRKPL